MNHKFTIQFSSRKFSSDYFFYWRFFYMKIKSKTNQTWYDSGIGLWLIAWIFTIVFLHIYIHDSAGAPLLPRVPRAPLPPCSTLTIKKTNFTCWHRIYYDVLSYDDFYVPFLHITQKLMPFKKFWFQIWNLHQTNTLIKRKVIIQRNAHYESGKDIYLSL